MSMMKIRCSSGSSTEFDAGTVSGTGGRRQTPYSGMPFELGSTTGIVI